jgi:PPOX class probable F420-dependent enzyme
MPSRRDQIKMTEEEVREFLAAHMVMQCATLGPRGLPHVVPLWYVPDGLELRGWTYAKSQKAKNLERDPRATVAIEDGVRYEELRGVSMECDVELDRDPDLIGEVADALVDRYGGGSPEMKEVFRKQVTKRVALRFSPSRIVTWDHRKLAGGY